MIYLFFQFVKYGILCFGGGYMIIPLLYNDFVINSHFFTSESYGNLLAISQMTPGAVSINTATYIGFLKANIIGSIVASIGLCFPTFVLSSIFLSLLCRYKNMPIVINFFKGAKWTALTMVIFAIGLFSSISIFQFSENTYSINWFEIIITIVSILLICKKIPFTFLLVAVAIIGWLVSYL